MDRILIVEDSELIARQVQKRITQRLGIEVERRTSFAETVNLLGKQDSHFSLALLDLSLPDSPYGEIVDYVLSKNIPSIVFTADVSLEAREQVWAKKVVDYVQKEGSHNIDYVVMLVRRILRNRHIQVMVVDDSDISRAKISSLLRVHQYQVLEASDGHTAMQVLRENPHISMAITDCFMPSVDGFQLTRQIRESYPSGHLAIIGVSAGQDPHLSARFIKNGANDFLTKPFTSEQFYCRVNQNIEMVENIRTIREASQKDFLTGLSNRRHFFEVARSLFPETKGSKAPMALGMVDLDYFKKINDTYGHEAGDLVLQRVAWLFQEYFPSPALVARFGGEEFCICVPATSQETLRHEFEALRSALENLQIVWNGVPIPVTASMGVCLRQKRTLEEMIRTADDCLYAAKEGGRNRVLFEGENLPR